MILLESKNIFLTKISKIKNYLNFKIEINFYIASTKLYILLIKSCIKNFNFSRINLCKFLLIAFIVAIGRLRCNRKMNVSLSWILPFHHIGTSSWTKWLITSQQNAKLIILINTRSTTFVVKTRKLSFLKKKVNAIKLQESNYLSILWYFFIFLCVIQKKNNYTKIQEFHLLRSK